MVEVMFPKDFIPQPQECGRHHQLVVSNNARHAPAAVLFGSQLLNNGEWLTAKHFGLFQVSPMKITPNHKRYAAIAVAVIVVLALIYFG